MVRLTPRVAQRVYTRGYTPSLVSDNQRLQAENADLRHHMALLDRRLAHLRSVHRNLAICTELAAQANHLVEQLSVHNLNTGENRRKD